jgi:hypothetical protein
MAKTLAAIASEPDIILHRQFTMEFLLFIQIKVVSKRIVRANHDGFVIFCPVSAAIRLLVRDGVNTDFFGLRHAPQPLEGRIVIEPAWIRRWHQSTGPRSYVCLPQLRHE